MESYREFQNYKGELGSLPNTERQKNIDERFARAILTGNYEILQGMDSSLLFPSRGVLEATGGSFFYNLLKKNGVSPIQSIAILLRMGQIYGHETQVSLLPEKFGLGFRQPHAVTEQGLEELDDEALLEYHLGGIVAKYADDPKSLMREIKMRGLERIVEDESMSAKIISFPGAPALPTKSPSYEGIALGIGPYHQKS